jgi:hypothetical protein
MPDLSPPSPSLVPIDFSGFAVSERGSPMRPQKPRLGVELGESSLQGARTEQYSM